MSASLKLSKKNIHIAIFIFFFISEAFSGILRWGLATISQEYLIYAPKILLAASIIPLIMVKTHTYSLMLFILILFSLTLGIFNFGFFHAMFALFIIIPFIYGLFFPYLIQNISPALLKAINRLFIISSIGIVYTFLFVAPWVGFSYELFVGDIESNRQWWSGGFIRSSGFTRISHIAASLIAFLSITMLLYYKRKPTRLLIFIITILMIFLTTSKTVLIAYIVLLPLASNRLRYSYSKFFILALVIFQILIFLLFMTPNASEFFKPDNNIEEFLFGSFYIRITETWPLFFESVINESAIGNFSWITGGGLGSTGTPQKIFTPTPNLADNGMFFLWAIFGLPGIVLYLSLHYIVLYGLRSNNLLFQIISYQSLMALICGITTDIWENTFYLMVIGFLVSFYLNQAYQSKRFKM